MLGTGISSDTVCLLVDAMATEAPFEWENREVAAAAAPLSASCDRFLISVTDRRLQDCPSLDASDIDIGEVRSSEPIMSAREWTTTR